MRKYPKSMHMLRSPRGAISACRVLESPAKEREVRLCYGVENGGNGGNGTSYGVFRGGIEASVRDFTGGCMYMQAVNDT